MAKAKKPSKTRKLRPSKRDIELQKKINASMRKIQEINELSRQKMRRALLIAVLGNIAIVLVFIGIIYLIKMKYSA